MRGRWREGGRECVSEGEMKEESECDSEREMKEGREGMCE